MSTQFSRSVVNELLTRSVNAIVLAMEMFRVEEDQTLICVWSRRSSRQNGGRATTQRGTDTRREALVHGHLIALIVI